MNHDFKQIINNDNSLKELYDYLTNPFVDNRNTFNVYTMETSSGKTLTTIISMIDYIEFCEDKKAFVFLSKTNKECINIVKQLNELSSENIAITYCSNKQLREEHPMETTGSIFDCFSYPIVVLTHATYKLACLSENDKYKSVKSHILQYSTLVIDEEFNAVMNTNFSFSKYKYEEFMDVLKDYGNITCYFEELCYDLVKIIEDFSYDNDTCVTRATMDMENYIGDLKFSILLRFIEELDNEVLKDKSYEKSLPYEINKAYLIDLCWNIRNMIFNCCEDKTLYCYKTLYTCNMKFEHIMLNKNIMLDASGKFLEIYDKSSLFNVIDSERTISHKESNLIWINKNTSRTAKNEDLTNFRQEVINTIRDNSKGKKALIVTNKSECKALEDRFIKENFIKDINKYDVQNFMKLRGLNDYSDWEDCYIIHTLRQNPSIYVLMYMYYVNVDLKEKDKKGKLIDVSMDFGKYNGTNMFGFENKVLDSIMCTDIASNVYQSLKRVQRNRQPKGNYYIMMNDQRVVNIIKDNLKEVNFIMDGKKLTKKEMFNIIIKDIRDRKYDKEYFENKKGKKIKCIKRIKNRYIEINREWICFLLDITNSNLKYEVLNKNEEVENVNTNEFTIKI